MSKKSLRFTLKALVEAGYVEHEKDKFIHLSRVKGLSKIKTKRPNKINRTGWIDDSRNQKCLTKKDMFCQLIQSDLKLTVWPEFHAHPDRKWRIDYAIPLNLDGKVLKVAIEVEGGVWTNGRHTRGKGFKGDMEKYNYLTSQGWKLIRVEPDELITITTIELIKAQLFD